jgi:hypothetical protein
MLKVGFGAEQNKDQSGFRVQGKKVTRKENEGFNLEMFLSVLNNRLEKNEGERTVFRSGNHRCLRNESPRQCLFGLLEIVYTSPAGIYRRCGRVALVSTWDN